MIKDNPDQAQGISNVDCTSLCAPQPHLSYQPTPILLPAAPFPRLGGKSHSKVFEKPKVFEQLQVSNIIDAHTIVRDLGPPEASSTSVAGSLSGAPAIVTGFAVAAPEIEGLFTVAAGSFSIHDAASLPTP